MTRKQFATFASETPRLSICSTRVHSLSEGGASTWYAASSSCVFRLALRPPSASAADCRARTASYFARRSCSGALTGRSSSPEDDCQEYDWVQN